MDQASPLEVLDKLAMPGHILFGILNLISFSEIETRLSIYQHCWYHIMDMLWMTKHYSELVKEF